MTNSPALLHSPSSRACSCDQDLPTASCNANAWNWGFPWRVTANLAISCGKGPLRAPKHWFFYTKRDHIEIRGEKYLWSKFAELTGFYTNGMNKQANRSPSSIDSLHVFPRFWINSSLKVFSEMDRKYWHGSKSTTHHLPVSLRERLSNGISR